LKAQITSEFANFISGIQLYLIRLSNSRPSMVSTVQNSTGTSCAVDFEIIVWTSGWNMFMWKIWLAPSTIGTSRWLDWYLLWF
jgi:hypothetical protein